MEKFKIIISYISSYILLLTILILLGYSCLIIGDIFGFLAIVIGGFVITGCTASMFSMSMDDYNSKRRYREYQEKYGKIEGE